MKTAKPHDEQTGERFLTLRIHGLYGCGASNGPYDSAIPI